MQRNKNYLVASDLFSFIAAYAFGGFVFWQIRHSDDLFQSFWQWTSVFLLIVPIGIVWFYLKGHYTRRWPFWDEMRGVTQVLTLLAIIEGALIFLTKSTFSRIWFASTFSIIFIALPFCRHSVKALLLRFGKWQLSTVIIGASENARDVLHALQSEHQMGFNVKYFLSDRHITDEEYADVPIVAMSEDFEEDLVNNKIQCVIIAPDIDGSDWGKVLLERLQSFTQHLYLVPAMRGVPLHGLELHFFFRHEVIMMRVRNNLLRPVVRFFKRGFDVVGSIFLLCLLSPLMITLGLLVGRDGGPVFFGHERIGLGGRNFKCLKFRSMVTNADEILQRLLTNDERVKAEWEKDFKLKDDPRITRIGVFLRNSSLDELPQLWNILKGEMSLVGPRPLVEEELSRYGEQVSYYLRVRPGMTGLWQVSGRNDVDYDHRVYLDVWYVKNWSMWYDVAILFKTFKVVLSRQGAY